MRSTWALFCTTNMSSWKQNISIFKGSTLDPKVFQLFINTKMIEANRKGNNVKLKIGNLQAFKRASLITYL